MGVRRAGPLNAGSFGPNSTDGTFGPQVVFAKAPPAGQVNLSPYAGLQFFGEVNIDQESRVMTVDLKDIDGAIVFSKTLSAEHDRGIGNGDAGYARRSKLCKRAAAYGS